MSKIISNKYSKWYFELIRNSRKRNLIHDYERHHILPKCCGGKDISSNLIKLTYKEHFIAHLLLTKMFDDKNIKYKLVWALHRLSFSRKLNSYQYEIARKMHIRNMKENHPSKISSKWSMNLSISVKESWENAPIERRNQASKSLKQLWDNDRERMLKLAKINGLKGANASKIKLKGSKRPECSQPGERNPMAKKFVIRTPEGKLEKCNCLKTYCDENQLSYDSMLQVSCGKNKQHKGYFIERKEGQV